MSGWQKGDRVHAKVDLHFTPQRDRPGHLPEPWSGWLQVRQATPFTVTVPSHAKGTFDSEISRGKCARVHWDGHDRPVEVEMADIDDVPVVLVGRLEGVFEVEIVDGKIMLHAATTTILRPDHAAYLAEVLRLAADRTK